MLSGVTLAYQHRGLVIEQGFAGEFLGRLCGMELANREVHAAVAQQRLGNGHQAFEQFQLDLWHTFAKSQHDFGQEGQGDPWGDPDAEPALSLATHVIKLGLCVLQLLDHQPGVSQQHFAVFGEVQTAGGSGKQR
ncbi:hypothetical protein D3C86_1319440 [compost metagenome]